MHDHLVNNCSFSSDGKWLVTASSDYSARLWALPSMRLQAVMSDHSDDVDMAIFSPDDQMIATCALDRLVRVFDLKGQCLMSFQGHSGNVLALAWSQHGEYLFSTSVDGTIRKWEIATGLCIQITNISIRTDSLEIASNGTIYAGDDSGRICVINEERIDFIPAHLAGIKKVVLNSSNGTLVCLSYDRSMSVWDISNESLPIELNRTILPEVIWARAACITLDGRILTGTFGSTFAEYDLKNAQWAANPIDVGFSLNDVLKVGRDMYSVGDAGTVFKNKEIYAEMGSLCNFLVKAEGVLLTGGQLGLLFNADTAEVLYRYHSPLNCGVAFVMGGVHWVCIGTYTGEILIFQIIEGSLRFFKNLKVYENAIKGLSFKNGVVFSVCASTEIAWHRVSTWSLVKEVDHSHDKITNDCCAVDDEQFATVSRDRTLRIWSDHSCAIYPTPHPHSVKCISISEDGQHLLTGCYGGTLAMFDMQQRRWSKVERPTMSGISSITWDSSDGQFLAASYDGSIYPMGVSA
jgi:WD40 repeat protein